MVVFESDSTCKEHRVEHGNPARLRIERTLPDSRPVNANRLRILPRTTAKRISALTVINQRMKGPAQPFVTKTVARIRTYMPLQMVLLHESSHAKTLDL